MSHILRLPSVIQKFGKSRSGVYRDIKEGLLPHPIHIGSRSVGWPDSEVDAIINARIAGKSNSEIRTLVKKLVAKRTRIVEAA